MALEYVENLNAVQLDTLKEIGNIGQGNAASALSDMMGRFVNVSVPDVKLLNFGDTVNYLGGAENTVIGIVFTLSGDINGMLMQVLSESVATKLIRAVTGNEEADISHFNDIDMSCLQELGNILAGSYINAIASLTGLNISISIPNIMVDMAGAILSIPAIEFAKIGNKVLLIDDNFIIDKGELMSNMLLVPDLKSLSVLFSKLGVEN